MGIPQSNVEGCLLSVQGETEARTVTGRQVPQHQRRTSSSNTGLPFAGSSESVLQAMPSRTAGKAPSLGGDGRAAARRL